MADDLKRVGLVFNADGSTDFIKSVNLVNATLKENFENFKLVQAQWDNSTKTSQKLADKLEYLNNAYDIQQDKVNALKKQLEALESAENKDEVAIQKKRAALATAETSLQKYKNQIEGTIAKLKLGTEEMKEFALKLDDIGKQVSDVGSKLSIFSVAAVAAFTAAANSAIEFDSAFIGVEKTVDASTEQLSNLKNEIRKMAQEIPATTTEIAAVAEAAGQLGIKTEDIMNFTRVMIDLGESTNLTAEDAASSLAKFANVTGMTADNYSRLGATIVALGNNFATTEADIVEMATRLASAGTVAGLTESQILALATSMSSVGIEAEAGGSAMSTLLKKLQVAVETSSESLKDYAKVANMTSKEFQNAFEENAVDALSAFISGLNDTERNGKSAINVLEELGLTEIRLSNMVLSLANASDVMNESLEIANKGWDENEALTKEAEKRYASMKSQIQIAGNKLNDVALTLGNKLMPKVQMGIDKLSDLTDEFNNLSDEQVDLIIKAGMFVVAIGPVVNIIGKVTTATGMAINAFATLKESLAVAKGTMEATSMSASILGNSFKAISSPIGLACTAAAVSIAAISIASKKATEETRKDFETLGNSASDFVVGIQNAESYLNSFNETLFATSEEQQELQNNMVEIQNGITEICKKATEERRDYTSQEIQQLDEYFTKLRDLKNQEIAIQNQIAEAITKQAVSNAESFNGSLEEYKISSQNWIKTAQEQKDKTLQLIEEQTIQEVVLLNQRYENRENIDKEQYEKEYNEILLRKEEKINAANEEVAKVTEIYANSYLQRTQDNDSFYNILKEYANKQEALEAEHAKKIEQIKNGELWYVTNTYQSIQGENTVFAENQKQLWEKMYTNMSDSQSNQLGVWLAQLAQTELYGGKIDEETQKIVNSIINSYDSMPKETREAMKNAMSPMLEEMQKKEPSLFAKATGIANGILTRLKKSFDIHSPSRKTREIFKNVMLGAEKGMVDEEKKLYDKTEDIANNVQDNLESINPNYNFKSTSPTAGNNFEMINYSKMAEAIIYGLSNAKFTLDEEGFVRIVKKELYKVV